MSGRPADGTTRMATAAAGTGTLAATPKQRGAAGRAEAVRTVTMTIARDVRIVDTAAGSEIPAAIPRPPAADGRTVAENQGCVRPPGRALPLRCRQLGSGRSIMADKTFLIDYEWLGKTLSCRLHAGEWDQAEEQLDA